MEIYISAKELFEAAMQKLQRRSADVRGVVLQVQRAAERGYAPARVQLAWSYIFGEGVDLDIEKGKEMFEELANEGNADAHAVSELVVEYYSEILLILNRILSHIVLLLLVFKLNCASCGGEQGVGFLHAAGLGVGVSQARALLHYTLGALGGSDFAQMALAYRHWAAVGVPASCPKAMQLYMKVAAKGRRATAAALAGLGAALTVRVLQWRAACR